MLAKRVNKPINHLTNTSSHHCGRAKQSPTKLPMKIVEEIASVGKHPPRNDEKVFLRQAVEIPPLLNLKNLISPILNQKLGSLIPR